MFDPLKDLSPQADEKQEQRLTKWVAGEGIPFRDDQAKALYVEKSSLVKDAIQMKRLPVRVPVNPSPGHFPLEYAGVRFYDAMYDPAVLAGVIEKFHNDFNPDFFFGSAIGSGEILDLLDAKNYHWPGHGVSKDHEYQFVEEERMLPEEYDELINDPTDFHLRRFLPRLCGTLKPLGELPPIIDLRHMSSMAGGTSPFALAEMQETFAKLAEAGKIAQRWVNIGRDNAIKIIARGYPALAGGTCEAPYDIIADSYRGTRGMSLDMIRRPEKVLQACDVLVPSQIRRAVTAADLSGSPMIFMPLHKGAHAFMSRVQFARFYWPTLRKLLMGMINEGLVPFLFAESDYNSRLDIISDLPRGRVVWWFENIDMIQAKAVVGQTNCIAGNLPNILFRTGTTDDVKAQSKALIDSAGKGGGYILSTAAGMQGAKPENVRTMIEFSREYGVYS